MSSADPHDPGGIRLQKVLAAAGLGSRRNCEELIADGRVAVDGKRVREQGMRVDPDRAVITVDGDRIVTEVDMVYLACHKPRGMVSAMSDDPNAGDTKPGRPPVRATLADLVADRLDRGERLFHVGRLDLDSEGLLLLTNDGELGHRLSHPSYEVPKIYMVDVLGPVGKDILRQLRQGVDLEDGPAKVDEVRVLDAAGYPGPAGDHDPRGAQPGGPPHDGCRGQAGEPAGAHLARAGPARCLEGRPGASPDIARDQRAAQDRRPLARRYRRR